MFNNPDLEKSLYTIENELLAYFTACHNSRQCILEIEEAISEKLLLKIEEELLLDGFHGGDHDYKYVTINNQNVLVTDGLIFCDYQAANEISDNIGFPIEGQFDLTEEGERLLEMIDDLGSLPLDEYRRKYYDNVRYRAVDKLMEYLESSFSAGGFRLKSAGPYALFGYFPLDGIGKLALAQFCLCNPDCFITDFKGSTVYIEKIPVAAAEIHLSAQRRDLSKPLEVYKLEVNYSPDADYHYRPGIRFTPDGTIINDNVMCFDVNISPALGSRLGGMLTEAFPEELDEKNLIR
ncbi:MAG: hypothetical protein ACI4XA_04750 [Oscillospiraceae bacterium]